MTIDQAYELHKENRKLRKNIEQWAYDRREALGKTNTKKALKTTLDYHK